jgi:hypothetical protein
MGMMSTNTDGASQHASSRARQASRHGRGRLTPPVPLESNGRCSKLRPRALPRAPTMFISKIRTRRDLDYQARRPSSVVGPRASKKAINVLVVLESALGGKQSLAFAGD